MPDLVEIDHVGLSDLVNAYVSYQDYGSGRSCARRKAKSPNLVRSTLMTEMA